MPHNPANPRRGLSLNEMLASVTILGVVAAMGIVRFTGSVDDGQAESCHIQKAEIELQAQLWRRNTGSFPATTLSDIELDSGYFPEGLPTCPVDATPYTIDAATGRVVGHNH